MKLLDDPDYGTTLLWGGGAHHGSVALDDAAMQVVCDLKHTSDDELIIRHAGHVLYLRTAPGGYSVQEWLAAINAMRTSRVQKAKAAAASKASKPKAAPAPARFRCLQCCESQQATPGSALYERLRHTLS